MMIENSYYYAHLYYIPKFKSCYVFSSSSVNYYDICVLYSVLYTVLCTVDMFCTLLWVYFTYERQIVPNLFNVTGDLVRVKSIV